LRHMIFPKHRLQRQKCFHLHSHETLTVMKCFTVFLLRNSFAGGEYVWMYVSKTSRECKIDGSWLLLLMILQGNIDTMNVPWPISDKASKGPIYEAGRPKFLNRIHIRTCSVIIIQEFNKNINTLSCICIIKGSLCPVHVAQWQLTSCYRRLSEKHGSLMCSLFLYILWRVYPLLGNESVNTCPW
jgi:hypothetical protein